MSGEHGTLALSNVGAPPLLAALVANLPIGALLQAPDGRIAAVNAAFIQLTGISARPVELIGIAFDGTAADVHDMFGTPGPGVVGPGVVGAGTPGPGAAGAAPPVAGAGPAVGTALLAGLNGERTVERQCVPLHAGDELLGHLWLLRDVTDQAAARRAAAEQDRVLADLTTLRSDFVATLSHELRTPLTSLVGLSTLLLDGGGALDPEQTECLQAIGRSADRLLRLTDDLTLLAGLESGMLPLRDEPVDLAGVVAERAEAWGEAAVAAGVGLDLDCPDPGPTRLLHGDQATLTRLLDDLITDAIAASPAGSTVRLALRPEPDGWRIAATDPEAQPDDPAETSRHTAGLGRIIGRAIVERHHGSTNPAGTELHIQLPAGQPGSSPSPP